MAISVAVFLIEDVEKQKPFLDETFFKDELTLGRNSSNDLVLSQPDVSGSHAKLYSKPNLAGQGSSLFITDLKSSNGTFLEDVRLNPGVEYEIKSGQRLVVGSFLIQPSVFSTANDVTGEMSLKDLNKSPVSAPEPVAEAKPAAKAKVATEAPIQAPTPSSSQSSSSGSSSPSAPSASYEEELKLKRSVHEMLIERLELRRKDIAQLTDEELRGKARNVVEQILVDIRWQIPAGLERDSLIREVLDEALGLGPLEQLLAEEDCSEIMVNSYDQIYAERQGKLSQTQLRFSGEQAVLAAIERILAPIGRRIDESSPMVDARLKDGSRVNAVIRPLALRGPCITIRKFAKVPLTVDSLVKHSSLSQGMANFLKLCVEQRLNIVISGGTGSGKTTLLNIVSSFIPDGERVLTVEDAAELQLRRAHLISFESRPANLEGKGAITIRDLVRNALRMRPDRIIVGECRGAEALDMLQAMNTGHDGSMTTGHANSPADMVRRLETMVLTSGLDLPIRAVREQIASAVDIVVQQTRFACGSRKITAISEVSGMDYDEGSVQLEDIFVFREEGYGADGKIQGVHQATGYIPRFMKVLEERGISIDAGMFSLSAT